MRQEQSSAKKSEIDAMIKQSCTLLKNSDMVFRKITGEFLLIPVYQNDSKNQFIFSLNETGKQIWELIDNKKNTEEIIRILQNEFNVDKNQIEKDIIDFIDILQKIGGVSYEMPKSATD